MTEQKTDRPLDAKPAEASDEKAKTAEPVVITQGKYIASAVKKDQYPERELPEVVFIGRSNVGKSSLINSLTRIRGKERRKIWKKFIDEYLLTSPQLQFVCQLIDIRHEPMASDVEMFQWLVEHHVPVLIIATKADKIGKNARQKNIAAIRRALGVKEISILPYSSVKNEGRSDLLDVIREILV